MASVPGVNVPQGQQGWYQPVYIRGGDLDQVGWEFDGIPVNRSYDNAPQTFISSLGQQELQVYTGGTLPSADASGIAGYVNQVVKRGTVPGFADLSSASARRPIYNKVSAEAGGATAGSELLVVRRHAGSRHVLTAISTTATVPEKPRFFYPLNTTFFGNSKVDAFDPGNTYGIASTHDRESVVNFHFGIPHKTASARTIIQALWMTGYLLMPYYSSINDLGRTRPTCRTTPSARR